MRRVAYENMRDLSFIVQELKTLMATDWSLARLQVPGLVIMADDGAGTVYTVYIVHRPSPLHPGAWYLCFYCWCCHYDHYDPNPCPAIS